jgi:integrase
MPTWANSVLNLAGYCTSPSDADLSTLGSVPATGILRGRCSFMATPNVSRFGSDARAPLRAPAKLWRGPVGTKNNITIEDYLLPEEAFEFVRAARSEMYRVMALVVVRSGLRLGELRALRWSEVDFERAQVNVIRAYSLDEITLPKGNRRRDVPLPSDALMALAGRKRVAGDRELVPPEPTNVVHLTDFQSKNESVARPELVSGPVFKFTSAPKKDEEPPSDT